MNRNHNSPETQHPVDLELKYVLGSMPQKVSHTEFVGVAKKTDIIHVISISVSNPYPFSQEFVLDRVEQRLSAVDIHVDLREALDRVLRLPSVASKRYLTNKVR